MSVRSFNLSHSHHQQNEQKLKAVLECIRKIIPPLSVERHKGQSGRIAIIGGSFEYTGAPYFAGISALRTGADLSHIFCTLNAGVSIKAYSPELIVHPLLDHECAIDKFQEWMPRMHCLVIGPGLGRDPTVLSTVSEIILKAKENRMNMIIDADGMFLITEKPDLIRGYKSAILTPNKVEFSRLYSALIGKVPDSKFSVSNTVDIANALGNVTIVQKGSQDIISNGDQVLLCNVTGSPRRCGGQGDILSGCMGTFLHWAHVSELAVRRSNTLTSEYSPTIIAAYAACLLTRTCAEVAFESRGRSMIVSDLIDAIHPSFRQLFESSKI